MKLNVKFNARIIAFFLYIIILFLNSAYNTGINYCILLFSIMSMYLSIQYATDLFFKPIQQNYYLNMLKGINNAFAKSKTTGRPVCTASQRSTFMPYNSITSPVSQSYIKNLRLTEQKLFQVMGIPKIDLDNLHDNENQS